MAENYTERKWKVGEIIDKYGPSKMGSFKLTFKATDGNISTTVKKWFNKGEALWENGKEFTAALEEVTNTYGTDLMVKEDKPAFGGGFKKDDPLKEARIMRGNALNAASYLFAGKGKDCQGAMWATFRAMDEFLKTEKRVRMSTTEQHAAIVKMFKDDIPNARAAVWNKFGREYIEELSFEEAASFRGE
jgi:hypothetical protein